MTRQKPHVIKTLLVAAVLFIALHINFSHQIDHEISSPDACSFCLGAAFDGLDTTIKSFIDIHKDIPISYLSTIFTNIGKIKFVSFLHPQGRAPPSLA